MLKIVRAKNVRKKTKNTRDCKEAKTIWDFMSELWLHFLTSYNEHALCLQSEIGF